jgi:hypothetical protein
MTVNQSTSVLTWLDVVERAKANDVQCQTVRPAKGKILNVDFLVWCGLALAPEQKSFLSRETLLTDDEGYISKDQIIKGGLT